MSLPNRLITSGKPYSDSLLESTAQEFELGTLWAPNNDPLGRKFRYTKNAAVALTAGNVIQGAARIADHNNIALGGAAAAGQKEVVVVTTLSTTLADLQYHGGFMAINDADAEGVGYPVVSHTDTTTPTITLGEDIKVALATGSQFTLTPNPYRDVIELPVTIHTAPVLGVPRIAVTASNYFWCQTKGPAAVLGTGTLIIGDNVAALATSVAGAVGVATALHPVVGYVMSVNATTEYSTIFLTLDQ